MDTYVNSDADQKYASGKWPIQFRMNPESTGKPELIDLKKSTRIVGSRRALFNAKT